MRELTSEERKFMHIVPRKEVKKYNRKFYALPGESPQDKLWLFFVVTKWTGKEIQQATRFLPIGKNAVYARLAEYKQTLAK